MNKQDKELLIKDLCARLPYGVKIETKDGIQVFDIKWLAINMANIKNPYLPYLRPMSSMTEKEVDELKMICDDYDLCDECGDIVSTIYGMTVLYGEVENVYPYNLKIKISKNLNYAVLDFLNTHHFDYRGLIPMGLALEAPEGMYNFK